MEKLFREVHENLKDSENFISSESIKEGEEEN